MRIFAAVMAVVICGGSTSWADRADSPALRWSKTDLNFEIAKTFVSNSKCLSSLKYLKSCIAAIDAANKTLNEPVSMFENGFNFEQVLNEIAQRLPSGTPVQFMLANAINAHLETFDAHSYLAPADSVQASDGYFGVGLFVRKVERGFLVTESVEGSPSDRAKMSFGDLITGIEDLSGEDFSALSVPELAERMRGPAGTAVRLRFEREGSDREVTLTRGKIEAKNVKASVAPFDPTLGYMRIADFIAGQTCLAVKKSLHDLKAAGAKKLILDMRGNPGGSTRDAICTASLFLGPQEIVGLQSVDLQIPETDLLQIYDTSKDIRWARGFNLEADPIPLAILVDGLTGSAAEIVSGALQAKQRAWLVGERTFGKGSQQTFTDYPGHPSMIFAATTDLVILPNLKSHQRVGLTPSFPVGLSPDPQLFADLEHLSERDSNPNSLAAVNESWDDPRPDKILAIQKCIEREGYDRKFLGAWGPASGDYQRSYAAAVLKCDMP